MTAARLALLLALVFPGACRRDRVVASLLCQTAADCSPPAFICGADGRCVPGCVSSPSTCIGGATCDPSTGECAGGLGIGRACDGDPACDPPDLICRLSTDTCVAGCTLAGADACATGFVCDPLSGHCCDPTDPACPAQSTRPPSCNTDAECMGAPANICSGGTCVPGCASGGACVAPLACDAATGHCATPSCARDLDCDDGSYCTHAGTCSVLAFGGPISCAGGTVVYYRCAVKTSAAEFAACVGAPGPAGCPYCIEYSCLHAGICGSDADCHQEDACTGGLCRVRPAGCPTTVPISGILAGQYAAGKELCVRGVITSVADGYDGFTELRLGTSPYLFAEVPPMYEAAGVQIPQVGSMVTLHGTVRWDDAHHDRELVPVDWIGP